MSKKNSTILLSILLFVLLSCSQALSTTLVGWIYHDDSLIDLRIGGAGYYNCQYGCQLLKDGVVVKTWPAQGKSMESLYYSDPLGAMATWSTTEIDGSGNVTQSFAGFTNTSTGTAGALHNEAEMLTKLGRGTISWSGTRTVDVTVTGGITIAANSIINFAKNAKLTVEDNLILNGPVSINNTNDEPSFFSLLQITGPVTYSNLSLNGKIQFMLRDCSEITFDKLTYASTDDYSDLGDFLTYGSVGLGGKTHHIKFTHSYVPVLRTWLTSTSVISDIDFLNSTAIYIELLGHNDDANKSPTVFTVRDSTVLSQIQMSGNKNDISRNTITMQPHSDFGFLFSRGAAIDCSSFNPKGACYIKNNTIISGYPADDENAIEVQGPYSDIENNIIGKVTAAGNGYKNAISVSSDHVDIKNNIITGVSYAGISLSASSNAGSTIEGNVINESAYAGIMLASSTEATIKDSIIENVVHGIVISNSSNNKIGPENVINGASQYGITVGSWDNLYAAGNLIYENTLIDTVYGIKLDCTSGTCNNFDPVPKMSQNVIKGNRLNNRALGLNTNCQQIAIEEGVTWTQVSGNYIISGCAIGPQLAHDFGDMNFFDDGGINGGNYWDNYTGTDGPDPDNFGDTPYSGIYKDVNTRNQDNFPLLEEWVEYTIAPHAVDFGSVELDDGVQIAFAVADVVITNKSTEFPLFINKMGITGTDWENFSCDDGCQTPIKLEPGTQHTALLTYTPDKVNTDTAFLNIIHTGSSGTWSKVPLTGKGTDKTGILTGIKGQVTDGNTGIANVQVNAYTQGNITTPIATARSNFYGDYIISGLVTDNYLVKFDGTSGGFNTKWYDDQNDSTQATNVAVVTGQLTTDINAVLILEAHTVTPSVTGGNGAISPNTEQTVSHGTSLSFTLTPAANYRVLEVTGTCGGFLSGTTFISNAIYSDCTVIAAFSPDPFTVTPSVSGGNGTITPASGREVSNGGLLRLTLNPNSGYTIDKVEGTCGGILDGIIYTTDSISANCSVVASFKTSSVTHHIVTPGITGGHGQITSNLPQWIENNATAQFTLTAETGYTIDKVTGWCGGSLAGNTFTTDPITWDCEVTASFAKGLTVTPVAGENGSISPTVPQTVKDGSNVVFTVTADTGYKIDSVTGCNGTLNNNIYTTGPITENCSVNSTFKQATSNWLLFMTPILSAGSKD